MAKQDIKPLCLRFDLANEEERKAYDYLQSRDRPKKEETAKRRITDMYGYCQDNLFRASKNAVAKRFGEQPADIEKQEPNKQTVPTPSWLRGRKKKDDRDDR